MNNSLEQVIIEQNPHWDGRYYEHAFKRSHDEVAKNELRLPEIQIITGIRRCGKSTLLQELINHLMGETDPKSILYINFDDPNYTDICADARAIYDIVTLAEKLTACKVNYLFLDEVQHVHVWEKYVKSNYDSHRFKKIVVTASNADLLKGDYATLLSGRYVETHLYPLAYHEVLQHNGITDRIQLIKRKPETLRVLDNMLMYGGFPRIQGEEDGANRRKLLQSYYETIILKDCVSNHAVRETATLMNLAHFIINNIATMFSYTSLSKAMESNETTMQQFVHIFENAYFLKEIKQFSFSLKSQNRAKKKAYCIDNGLINATTFKFSHNVGKLLENFVYTELKKLGYYDIYYFNDKHECDFIVYDQKAKIAIQSCYDLNPENREREIRGLKLAMEKFSLPQGLVITYDQEERMDDNLLIVPCWKWASRMES